MDVHMSFLCLALRNLGRNVHFSTSYTRVKLNANKMYIVHVEYKYGASEISFEIISSPLCCRIKHQIGPNEPYTDPFAIQYQYASTTFHAIYACVCNVGSVLRKEKRKFVFHLAYLIFIVLICTFFSYRFVDTLDRGQTKSKPNSEKFNLLDNQHRAMHTQRAHFLKHINTHTHIQIACEHVIEWHERRKANIKLTSATTKTTTTTTLTEKLNLLWNQQLPCSLDIAYSLACLLLFPSNVPFKTITIDSKCLALYALSNGWVFSFSSSSPRFFRFHFIFDVSFWVFSSSFLYCSIAF